MESWLVPLSCPGNILTQSTLLPTNTIHLQIKAVFVNVPTNRIKHMAAINVHNQYLLLLIAALCFIPCCGHINEYGPKA